MAIQVSCPCGKIYRVADDKTGIKIRCGNCQSVLEVPRVARKRLIYRAIPLAVPMIVLAAIFIYALSKPLESSVEEVNRVEGKDTENKNGNADRKDVSTINNVSSPSKKQKAENQHLHRWTMVVAAGNNDLDKLKKIQQEGGDIHYRPAKLMHEAARNGAIDVMKWLRASGMDVNARDDYGNTPLHAAVEKPSLPAIRWLMENGAKSFYQNDHAATSLHLAAWNYESEDAIQLILSMDKMAPLNGMDMLLRTPLDMPEKEGRTTAWLRKTGAVKGGEIVAAARLGDDKKTWNMVGRLYIGASMVKNPSEGIKVLEAACKPEADRYGSGWPLVWRCEESPYEGLTPMHCAALADNVEIMEWLYSQGVSPSIRSAETQDAEDLQPIHAAANMGALNAIKWLVEKQNIDINAVAKINGVEVTALDWATKRGHTETVNWLKLNGAER